MTKSKKYYHANREYFKTHNRLPDNMNHGLSGYGCGCRCAVCTSADHGRYLRRVASSDQDYQQKYKDHFKQHGLPKNIKHGSMTAINNYGCTCDICKREKSDYAKQYRQKQLNHFKTTGKFLSPRTQHGTLGAYHQGCRCGECKSATYSRRPRKNQDASKAA